MMARKFYHWEMGLGLWSTIEEVERGEQEYGVGPPGLD